MPQSAYLQIPRCYDSHLHFFDAGEAKTYLALGSLASAGEVLRLEPRPENFRGHFLVGFGWDSSTWAPPEQPSMAILDRIFPRHPVYFVRADGHSCWINSETFERLAKPHGLQKNESGVYSELEKEKIFQGLPTPNAQEMEEFARISQDDFLQMGFTHLRDVGSKRREWPVLCRMAESGKLRVHLSLNYESFGLDEVDENIRWLVELRNSGASIAKILRPQGIKVYYDGALGSETALLTRPYASQKKGIVLWEDEGLKTVMRRTWGQSLELSVHTIGDEAVHRVLTLANDLLDEGVKGRLNLEHTEILAEKSRPLLKRVRPVCHLQPCHFLYDQKWLQQKIPHLVKDCFPWSRLQDDGVEFYFGSDHPIMPPDLAQTAEALKVSIPFGIPALKDSEWWRHHSHPDPTWGTEVSTFDPTSWKLQGIKF